ncbi:MAG: hypothetical protein PUE58_01760 [Lachnospiraceae bacterium]|nr:hypothetical protein [Lachnospiraceae bacterium]
MEDKQAICNALAKALQLTRNHSDLVAISYVAEEDMEFVIILWIGGTSKRIKVSMDSGTAMIRDILNGLR